MHCHELGIKGFDVSVRYAILAAVGAPAPIVQKLNAGIIEAMNMLEAKQRIEAAGYDIVGSTLVELDTFFRTRSRAGPRWSRIRARRSIDVNARKSTACLREFMDWLAASHRSNLPH